MCENYQVSFSQLLSRGKETNLLKPTTVCRRRLLTLNKRYRGGWEGIVSCDISEVSCDLMWGYCAIIEPCYSVLQCIANMISTFSCCQDICSHMECRQLAIWLGNIHNLHLGKYLMSPQTICILKQWKPWHKFKVNRMYVANCCQSKCCCCKQRDQEASMCMSTFEDFQYSLNFCFHCHIAGTLCGYRRRRCGVSAT